MLPLLPATHADIAGYYAIMPPLMPVIDSHMTAATLHSFSHIIVYYATLAAMLLLHIAP